MGSLVTSGSGAFAPTSVNYYEFYSELLGLNINLAAGNYWLYLAPVVSTHETWAVFSSVVNAATNSVNAVQDNQFLWRNAQFDPGGPVDFNNADLAVGAFGTVATPEPSSVLLIASGLGLVGFVTRRRKA